MSKKSTLIVATAIAALGLSSQAFAKGQPSPEGQPTPVWQDQTSGSEAFCRIQRQVWCQLAKGGNFHLNSYYQDAMAVTTPAFAMGRSSALGHVGRGFNSPAFNGAPPPVINTPAPVFNPSEPYTVPESRESPVSPASPGSVFGNG
jgi:hypothetical protein